MGIFTVKCMNKKKIVKSQKIIKNAASKLKKKILNANLHTNIYIKYFTHFSLPKST